MESHQLRNIGQQWNAIVKRLQPYTNKSRRNRGRGHPTGSISHTVLSLIAHLPEYYNTPPLEVKHKGLSSMFPHKLRYSNISFPSTPLYSVLSFFFHTP